MFEPASDSHDRAGFQQFHCCFGFIQADVTPLDCFKENLWQLVHVHLKAEIESLPRGQARPYPSELFPEDGIVQAELVTPISFAAEGVVAENLLALTVEAFGVRFGQMAERCAGNTLRFDGGICFHLAWIIETSCANCENADYCSRSFKTPSECTPFTPHKHPLARKSNKSRESLT